MADIQLCTLADLQNQGHMANLSAKDQAWCTSAIASLTRLAQKMSGREFTTKARTRNFNIRAEQRIVRVNAYGEESNTIGSIWQSLDSTYDATTLVASTGYAFDWENGIIEKKFGCWLPGVASVRVTWTGGVAVATANVPDDLKFAAILQVSAWYQRRDRLDVNSISIGGDSTTRFAEVDLLPIVKRTIDSYSFD